MKVGKIEIHCSHDELVDVTKIIANPKNPNKHPERQIQVLSKIIESQGFRSAITVSKRSGFVIKGHGRLMSAKMLGMEKVPVDYQEYSNEAEEWADMIADNRIAELSQINFDELTELLKNLDDSDFDITLTGFDATFLTNTDIDYSILDDDEEEDEKLQQMVDNTVRGHVIDFTLDDYDTVAEVLRWFRENEIYIGGVVLDLLTKYKAENE